MRKPPLGRFGWLNGVNYGLVRSGTLPKLGVAMKALAAVLLSLILAGCANPHRLGQESLQRGDTQLAERQLQQAIRDGDTSAWTSLAVLYRRQGKAKAATDAYIMGARYGEPIARAALAQMKLPVPPADLVRAPPAEAAASSFRRRSVECDTFTIGRNYATTTCR